MSTKDASCSGIYVRAVFSISIQAFPFHCHGVSSASQGDAFEPEPTLRMAIGYLANHLKYRSGILTSKLLELCTSTQPPFPL